MSSARDLRRCALQALYQFDAVEDVSPDVVRESLEASSGSTQVHADGFELALEAWKHHAEADEMVARLTPDWPTYRQPIIDRSILRLAHYEMTSGRTPPKVAINEAVELAREFSTERSPMFINGVLDKIMRLLRGEPHDEDDVPAETGAGADDIPGATARTGDETATE